MNGVWDQMLDLREKLLEYRKSVNSCIMDISSRQNPKLYKNVSNVLDKIDYIFNLLDRIDEVNKILDQVQDIGRVFLMIGEDNRNISNIKQRFFKYVNDLEKERMAIKDNCINAWKELRGLMRSVSSKEYKENVDSNLHNSISYMGINPELASIISGYMNIQDQERKMDSRYGFDASAELMEKQAEKETLDGIYDADAAIKDFETTKQYFLKTISFIPPSIKGPLLTQIKEEARGVTAVITPDKVKKINDLTAQLKRVTRDIAGLELIKEKMNGQQVSKEIDEIIKLVVKCLDTENKKHTGEITSLKENVQRIRFALQALNYYSTVLTGNKLLAKEQHEIRTDTHFLQQENRRLEKEDFSRSRQIAEMLYKVERSRDPNIRNDISRMQREQKEANRKIEEGKQYIKKKGEEVAVASLPQEYTDLKRKLKQVGALNEVIQMQSSAYTR